MQPEDDVTHIQGEGDYEAARRYNEAAKDTAQRIDIEQAGREAAPDSAEEAKVLEDAERQGAQRAKTDESTQPVDDASGSTDARAGSDDQWRPADAIDSEDTATPSQATDDVNRVGNDTPSDD